MKTINIHNRTLQYQIINDIDRDTTEFYEGEEDIAYRKYCFFGKTIVKRVPKLVFICWLNIEDKHKTKGEIRNILERHLEILDREEEIKRGELI